MPKTISSQIKIASYASLLNESDKGCLLLAAGIFDRKLEGIIAIAIFSILKGKPPKDFLKDSLFGDNGTLHTFSSKINIAHAFSLISRKEFDALHLLRKLRNEAAHCYFDFSFNDPGVLVHLNKLPRDNFTRYREQFLKEAGVKESEENTQKFDFVVNSYAMLHELHVVYIKQLHRYATKVRGLELPRLRKITGLDLTTA